MTEFILVKFKLVSEIDLDKIFSFHLQIDNVKEPTSQINHINGSFIMTSNRCKLNSILIPHRCWKNVNVRFHL